MSSYYWYITLATSTPAAFTSKVNVGNPTFAVGTDLSVTTLPTYTYPSYSLGAIGDSFTITANVDATATLPAATTGTYAVTFPSGTGTFAVSTITFGTSTSAIVTATAASTTGTWTKLAAATAALTTNVYPTAISGAANGDSITVTFPTGFTVPASGVVATLAATAGWVTLPGATVATNVAVVLPVTITPTSNSTNLTVTLTLPASYYIGAGAQILINITAGVINPTTAGSYAVTVATSQETTAVTSSTFAIVNPTIPTLPGVATIFNSAGIQMTQTNDFGVALGYVQTNTLTGAVIKLTAGTYTVPTVAWGTTTVALTIQGTDASAANVILQSTAPWTLSGKTVVVDSVTIDASKGGTLTVSTPIGGAGTVSNSMLKGGDLTMNNTGTFTGTSTLNKDTFTVKTGATGAILNNAAVNGAVVTACTFNVTGTGIGVSAIDDVTLSGSTFTGAAVTDNSTTATGVGISLTAGATGGSATSITGSTFTGLSPALVVADGTKATFSGNTVTACGVTSTYDAISVTGTTGLLYIMNNKITNSLQYIVNIALGGNDNNVFIMENNFSGNVKNVNNNDTTIAKVNATHNYWGGTASNPASTTSVDYSNPLGSLPTSTNFTTGVAPTSFDATATAGVNVTAITGATVIGAAALTGNPVTRPFHRPIL